MSRHRFSSSLGSTLTILWLGMVTGSFTSAQDDGPRWYWMAPVGTHVVNAFVWQTDGNTKPFSGGDFDPRIDIDSTVSIAGYNYYFDAGGRSASVTLWAPFGSVEGRLDGVKLGGSSGLADVYWQGLINLTGMPAMNLEDFYTHVPGTIVSFGLGGELPTGEYDENKVLNMGQNRYSLRASLPIVQPIGEWVPGKFTTFEIMPAVWFYGDNDDAMGERLQQDPLFMLEAHFTRDFTPELWGSLDYQYNAGGETSLDGVKQGDSQSASFIGATIGYNFSEVATFTFRYQGGLADPKEDLQLDIFRFEFNLIF